MMKTRMFKRILGAVTAASLSLSAVSLGGITASAGTDASTYTLTIPSTLTVANSGWNSIGNISATGDLADGKKLTVTATSTNSFALKSGSNSVAYKLANNTENSKTYSDATEAASWEFTELSSTAATKAIGIVVEDYSEKPAGTYQDTVTFTASVENMVQAGSISYATTSVNKKTTDSTFTNALTKTGDGSVTYSIAGDNVATINASTGVVTLSGNAGTATITATVTDSENYTYATKTATYTLTVEKPTTLADAVVNGATLEVMCKSSNDVNMGGNFTYNNGEFTLNYKVGTSKFLEYMKASASVSGTTITMVTGFTTEGSYDHTVTLNTSDNSYTLKGGSLKGSVTSVKVNGEEIFNDLTKN